MPKLNNMSKKFFASILHDTKEKFNFPIIALIISKAVNIILPYFKL